jgi:NAD(P)H-hydrate epimerase
MESAGRAVVEVVLDALRERPGEVVIVCGPGNNGGDGLVVARHLHGLGVAVRVGLLGGAAGEGLRGDAAANFARAQACGVQLDGPRWRAPLRGVVVDAIFGTGLTRKIGGAAAAAIRRIEKARSAGALVVAVDLPSGLDADTGQVLGVAVRADRTVTISLPKLGLALEPGRSHAGRVQVARIGIVDRTASLTPPAVQWTPLGAARALPQRPVSGHKGSFGHVLVVAGSEGKTGAAALAARAAARAGAGLVTVACPAGLNDVLETLCTEAMTAPVADTEGRAFAVAAEDRVLALAHERDVVALGPGLGSDSDTSLFARGFAKRCERPLVIDADGLNAFGAEPELLRARSAPTLLTPHPGEAARLLATPTAAINADRLAAARELAERSGCTVLLKGAGTIVAAPDRRAVAFVNPTGGPSLASGGTGDVLCGLAAALIAQGLDPFRSAALAAWVHGAAADRIAGRRGDAGLLASELADELPPTLHALRRLCEDRDHERPGRASLLLEFPDLDFDRA